jgi:hypothetical protein
MRRAKDTEQWLASRRGYGVRRLLRGDRIGERIGEEDGKELFDEISEPVGLCMQWLFGDVISLGHGECEEQWMGQWYKPAPRLLLCKSGGR